MRGVVLAFELHLALGVGAATGGDHGVERGAHLRVILLRDVVVDALADDLVHRRAVQRVVGEEAAVLAVVQREVGRGGRGDGLQHELAAPQRLVGFHAIGDVLDEPHGAHGAAALVEDVAAARPHVDDAAVGAHDAVIEIVVAGGARALLQDRAAHALAVFRVDQREPLLDGVRQLIRGARADEALDAVQQRVAADEVGFVDDAVHGTGGEAEPLFALAHRLLGGAPCIDVHDEADDAQRQPVLVARTRCGCGRAATASGHPNGACGIRIRTSGCDRSA